MASRSMLGDTMLAYSHLLSLPEQCQQPPNPFETRVECNGRSQEGTEFNPQDHKERKRADHLRPNQLTPFTFQTPYCQQTIRTVEALGLEDNTSSFLSRL